MRIHLPSLGLGVAISLSLALLLAADRPTSGERRYQLESNDSHVFVLDRTTGRVWEKYVPSNSGHTDQDFARPKIK